MWQAAAIGLGILIAALNLPLVGYLLVFGLVEQWRYRRFYRLRRRG